MFLFSLFSFLLYFFYNRFLQFLSNMFSLSPSHLYLSHISTKNPTPCSYKFTLSIIDILEASRLNSEN